jgi:thymidylate synthase (FAD)
MPAADAPGLRGLTAMEARVCHAARVSNIGLDLEDDDRTPEADVRLIAYLLREKHTSPFEHCTITFAVKLPIFVARQWRTHRTASYNEISARYAALPNEFYVPSLDRMAAQSASNKQASGEPLEGAIAEYCQSKIVEANRRAYGVYEKLLEAGLARELARTVLPQSVYTVWYTTANLHNWLHFLRLRTHPHAQWEIRQYAEAIRAQLRVLAPITMGFYAQTT